MGWEFWRLSIPEQVAAEDEAEHEDEEADAQDDDVDVEWQAVEVLHRHVALAQRSRATQTACEGGSGENSLTLMQHSHCLITVLQRTYIAKQYSLKLFVVH